MWDPPHLQLDGAPAPCLAQLLARVLSTAKPQLASANAARLHPRLAGLVLGSASSTFQLETKTQGGSPGWESAQTPCFFLRFSSIAFHDPFLGLLADKSLVFVQVGAVKPEKCLRRNRPD
jgi:hypothetical protein